ncbi:MAG: ribbon-helix-helix protein, CopG family [Acidobacteriota bacterium]
MMMKRAKRSPRGIRTRPFVTVQMPERLKERIDSVAAREDRSRGSLMRILLEEALAARAEAQAPSVKERS